MEKLREKNLLLISPSQIETQLNFPSVAKRVPDDKLGWTEFEYKVEYNKLGWIQQGWIQQGWIQQVWIQQGWIQ